MEVSELAHQANAALLVKHGETVVLVAVVMGHKETNLDYFPLTVDYEERFMQRVRFWVAGSCVAKTDLQKMRSCLKIN